MKIGHSCTYYMMNAAILFSLLSQYQIVYWSESPSFIQKATRPHTQMKHDNRPLQCAFIITHRNLSEVFNSLHGIYSALHHLTRAVYLQHLVYTHDTNGVRVLCIYKYNVYIWLMNCTKENEQAFTNTSMEHASKHSWFTLSASVSSMLFKFHYCDSNSTHFDMFRHQFQWMRVCTSSSSCYFYFSFP